MFSNTNVIKRDHHSACFHIKVFNSMSILSYENGKSVFVIKHTAFHGSHTYDKKTYIAYAFMELKVEIILMTKKRK